jgi:hypothetical protein
MWEYRTFEYIATTYEGYSGWEHKYDVPRHYVIHKILRLGKTGSILEVIAEHEALINTKLSKQIAKNFQIIVDAVNKEQECLTQ